MESIVINLNEAITWCSDHAQAESAGRSTRLIPYRNEMIIKSYKSTLEQRIQAFNGLIEQRRHLLDRRVRTNVVDLLQGEILRYEIDNTDACGLSPPESNNYIDDEDTPGWDTWFHIYEHSEEGVCILAWVPPTLVPLAQGAIDVNPVDCIKFVDLNEELEGLEKHVAVVNRREVLGEDSKLNDKAWWKLW